MDFNRQAVRAALEEILKDLDWDLYDDILNNENNYDFPSLVDKFIVEYEDADESTQ